MRSDILIVCFYTCFVLGAEDTNRDKRTIDTVIRGLADTFGYDVQKRPSMAQTRVAPVQPAAPLAPPAPRSTFFPPPVAPLPKTLPGPPTFSLRLLGGRQAAPAVSPAKPPPAPPVAPSKLMPSLPAPKRPLRPLPAATPAAPAAPTASLPVPPAIAPKPSPPLLRENIMKTFNIAFNFNRDLNTVAPPALVPAAPPPLAPPLPPSPGPKPGAPPKKTPSTPATKSVLRPPLPSIPAPTPAAPPASPQTLPPVATPSTPRKPQLYENDYNSEEYGDKQNLETIDYDQTEPVSYDYVNYVKGDQKKDPNLSYDDSRERFKQSLETFWAGSPYLQVQNTGYKFLAKYPEEEVQETPEFNNVPLKTPRNKYEEYEVLNGDYDESQPRNQDQQKFILYKSEYPSENEENQEIVEEEDAGASQNQPQKRKPSTQKVEPSKKEQIVNKIIRDFKEFERQRKNLPPNPNDSINPIKIREKNKQERERQRVIKERGQRTKEAIQRNINRGKGFVEPAYTGVIRAPLQELYQYDHKSHWPNPFDVDNAASAVEKQFKRIPRQVVGVADFKSLYQPDCYEAESDYTEPEPTKYDYSQYEKLHELDDASLSANAKIENKQFGTITVSVRANNDTSTY